MVEDSFHLVPLHEVSYQQKEAFLLRMFGSLKGSFLAQHGAWWHKGDENRFAVMLREQDNMAGYCAITPIRCFIAGEVFESLWWIDLIVDPDFRQRGLQRLMDDAIRSRPGLKLGFPNQFHSTILARHGWHVHGKIRKHMHPLRIHRVRFVRESSGWRGHALRFGSFFARPVFTVLRAIWSRYQPQTTRRIENPTPGLLAEIARRCRLPYLMTAERDESFFQWRYFDAPYRNELAYYTAGPVDQPEFYAVVRFTAMRNLHSVRILDIFGDFQSEKFMRDILATIRRDAVRQNADQIIVFSSQSALPLLRKVLRAGGYKITVPVFFCWHSPDDSINSLVKETPFYWTIADSDNDEPY